MRNLFTRPILLPPLMLLMAWAVVAFAMQRSITADQNRIDQLRNEQLALVVELDELGAAEQRSASIDADLDRFAVAVPASTDLGPLLRTLDAEAVAAGVRIDLLVPTNVASSTTTSSDRPVPPSMSSISIAVSGVGTFEAVMDLMARIENLNRLTVIDVVKLTSGDDEPGQILVDLEFRVFTSGTIVADDTAAVFEPEESP